MTRRSIALAAWLLAAAAPWALAQGTAEKKPDAPGAAQTPKPAAEMAQLKFFDGSWSCEGTMQPSPFGPGGKMKSSVTSKTDLGGFWQSGTVKGTMAGMPPFEGHFNMTYDPGGKQFAMMWVDNMGAWTHSTAPGWQGEKIVFAGDSFMNGQKVPSRDTFAKATDGSMKHQWEMQIDGKWMPMGDETCRKGAAK